MLGDIAQEHEAKLASYIDDQDRRREARARRALDRLLRYRVRKERARTRSIFSLGGYMVVNPFTNAIVAGATQAWTSDSAERR